MAKPKVVLDISEVIVGIHWPWVETNSFNPRRLVNDLKEGKCIVAIACEQNKYFNLIDHWLLAFKHRLKFKHLSNLIGFCLNRFIVIPLLFKKYHKDFPEYFLQYIGAGVYEARIPEGVKSFNLVILCKRDKWDAKVYTLPTNLNYTVESDGYLRGESAFLSLRPFSLKSSKLLPGMTWGDVEVK